MVVPPISNQGVKYLQNISLSQPTLSLYQNTPDKYFFVIQHKFESEPKLLDQWTTIGVSDGSQFGVRSITICDAPDVQKSSFLEEM
jgi:hypothetical protein